MNHPEYNQAITDVLEILDKAANTASVHSYTLDWINSIREVIVQLYYAEHSE